MHEACVCSAAYRGELAERLVVEGAGCAHASLCHCQFPGSAAAGSEASSRAREQRGLFLADSCVRTQAHRHTGTYVHRHTDTGLPVRRRSRRTNTDVVMTKLARTSTDQSQISSQTHS